MAGTAIASTALLLALIACIIASVACCCAPKRETKPRSVEIPARDLATPSEVKVEGAA